MTLPAVTRHNRRMSLPSILGDAAGGAYGATRGPRAIRRLLDTERTHAFVAVLATSLLAGALSAWFVVALVLSTEPRDRTDDVAALVLIASFGLLLVAALLAVTLGYLGYRWFTRGEKGGGLDVFTGEA